MSQDSRGGSGPADTGLVERAEALLDEAVGQAAKGSYRDAADKVQQALAIDPDNAVARDLLESYQRQVDDDDERRRRRRSIAAAAAAIEEMVESDRLEEAAAATEALAMQFGLDAPVDELRQRIAEARADQLGDLEDLDAAIDAIRLPAEGGRPPAARSDAGGGIVAQIEEHLRSGRLDEASSLVTRLESEPGAEDRARKLRTRIEEALHVAAEHRREEEILIATAAIEERLRLGKIDDATQRLADLAERHGSSAPVAELRERLAEARALAQQRGELASAAEGAVDLATAERGHLAAPMWGSLVEEEQRGGGRARWVAIGLVVAIALAILGWWWSQRPSTRTGQSITDDPARAVEGAATAPEAADRAATDGQDVVAAGDETTGAARGGATDGTVAVEPRSALTNAAPAAERGDAALVPPIDPGAAGRNGVSPPVTIEHREAAAVNGAADDDAALANDAPDAPAEAPSSGSFETESPAGATDGGAQVVVEAVSASEAPAAAPAPPPEEPAVSSSSAAGAAAAPAEPPAPAPADAAPARAEENESAPPPAVPQQIAAADRAPQAAPPPAAAPASASSGPAVLGCGAPGVVCLKTLQVPTPRYPAAARARRLEGDVVVMALVDEQGRVIQTRIDSSSFPFFNEAASEAARGATFQPATRQGVPGRSWARLTFKFQPP